MLRTSICLRFVATIFLIFISAKKYLPLEIVAISCTKLGTNTLTHYHYVYGSLHADDKITLSCSTNIFRFVYDATTGTLPTDDLSKNYSS